MARKEDSYDLMLEAVGQMYKDVGKAREAIAKAMGEVATAHSSASYVQERYLYLGDKKYDDEGEMGEDVKALLSMVFTQLDKALELADDAIDRLE